PLRPGRAEEGRQQARRHKAGVPTHENLYVAFLAARISSPRPPVVMARDYRLSSVSRASKRSLMSRPPAKPVSFPSEPTTRWQGAMIEIGFLPLAAPTARAARARPIWAAICP